MKSLTEIVMLILCQTWIGEIVYRPNSISLILFRNFFPLTCAGGFFWTIAPCPKGVLYGASSYTINRLFFVFVTGINVYMDIQFLKMHGLGNDFVILDARYAHIPTDCRFMRHIAHRRFGVGCDQIIVLRDSHKADIFMGIYNCDGSEAGACGNATRCVASLIMAENDMDICTVETIAAILPCAKDHTLSNGDFICVDMGQYKTGWADIPLSQPMDTTQVSLTCAGTDYTGYCVHMGNPHFVCVVADCESLDVPKVGAFIEHHPIFPQRTNVEFVTVISRNHIRMRVWERGGMVTMACGSGACAAAVACFHQGLTENTLRVTLDGGDLHIRVKPDQRVDMIGSYSTAFRGVVTYEAPA